MNADSRGGHLDPRSEEAELRDAAEALTPADLALLARVRGLWEGHDPVPDGLAERLEFALTLDALETEVATLTQVELSGAGVRSSETEAVRTVTFSSEALDTMVTLTESPDGTVRVDGWIAPGAVMAVDVLVGATTLSVEADEDGRFVVESVPRGLVKFALHPPGGRTVLSPTIEL